MNQSTKITDPKQAGERLLAFVREGRLVRGTWRDVRNGREYACHLGAAAGIVGASNCPESLMPAWVAEALPALFDEQTHHHGMVIARRWGEAMVRDQWSRIDWDKVRGEWMAFMLNQAQDGAAISVAAYADDQASRYSASLAAAYAAEDAAERADDREIVNVNIAAERRRDAARANARNAQAEALMDAIERSMDIPCT